MFKEIVEYSRENLVMDTYKFLKRKNVSSSLVNKILKLMISHRIDSYLEDIIDRININNSVLKKDLKNIFLLSDIKPIYLIKILEKIAKNEGILKEKLDGKNLLDLSKINVDGLEEIMTEIFFLTTKKAGQGSISVGVGEIFIAVFGKNGRLLTGSKKASNGSKVGGDVYFLDRKIEVKTSGEITKSIWNKVLEINIDEEEAKILGLSKGNYNTDFIQNKFGEKIKEIKKNKDVFHVLFKKYMVENINNLKYRNYALEFYNKNKRLSPDEILKRYLDFWFQDDHNLFEDYKKEYGFDSILYFKTKGRNVFDIKEFFTITPKDLPLSFTGFYSNGQRPINIRIKPYR